MSKFNNFLTEKEFKRLIEEIGEGFPGLDANYFGDNPIRAVREENESPALNEQELLERYGNGATGYSDLETIQRHWTQHLRDCEIAFAKRYIEFLTGSKWQSAEDYVIDYVNERFDDFAEEETVWPFWQANKWDEDKARFVPVTEVEPLPVRQAKEAA